MHRAVADADLTRRRFLQGTALTGAADLPGRLQRRRRRVRRPVGRADAVTAAPQTADRSAACSPTGTPTST